MKDKLKIAIICDVLGKENNGTSIAAMNLIRFLEKQGHDIHIVCPDVEKLGCEKYYVVPTLNFRIFNKYVEKNNVKLAKPDKNIIFQAIKDRDIIHMMLPFRLSIAVMKMAGSLNIPLSAGFHCQAENITAHLYLGKNKGVNNLVYQLFYKKFYKYVDAIHYPTEFIKNEFETQISKKTRGYVISNGVHPSFEKIKEKAEKKQEKFTIVFAGRLSKEKGHLILIDAIKQSKYENKIQLIFAGSGPQKEKILKYSEGLTNSLIMNFYNRDDLMNVFNNADLYCHPAFIEIEAISCLEAISCGLVPIIANSPKSATKYFALTENNLFENGNSKDLSRKIDFWIEHPLELEENKKMYMDFSKQFELTNCMKSMEKMFYEVLDTYKTKKGTQNFESE